MGKKLKKRFLKATVIAIVLLLLLLLFVRMLLVARLLVLQIRIATIAVWIRAVALCEKAVFLVVLWRWHPLGWRRNELQGSLTLVQGSGWSRQVSLRPLCKRVVLWVAVWVKVCNPLPIFSFRWLRSSL